MALKLKYDKILGTLREDYAPVVDPNEGKEVYVQLYPTDGVFSINYAATPFVELNLLGDFSFYSIHISNISDGEEGKILVKKTEGKTIAFDNVQGSFDMPEHVGDYLLVTYFCKGTNIYGHSQHILSYGAYKDPFTITDFLVVYYDSSVVQLTWTAPHGDQPADQVTEYDIRYANSIVDANDPAVWLSMRKVPGSPVPLAPGDVHQFTIATLKPNQEYFIYIKSVQIISGIKYTSLASNFAYCKTFSNAIDSDKPYKISILPESIFTQVNKTVKDIFGRPAMAKYMVDEQEKNMFLESSYPDLSNQNYNSYWQTYSYGRNTAYFRVIIDLWQTYLLDKLFIYSSSSGAYSVYAIKDIGFQPVKIAENLEKGKRWVTIDFEKTPTRFIVIQHDLQYFCDASTRPVIAREVYGIPDPYYNWDIGKIDNIIVYGTSLSGKPDMIKPVLQTATPKRTMSEFLCSNGHFYQSGRLHSKVSGKNIRLYGHPGHFSAALEDGTIQNFNTVSGVKFRLNRIPWVYQNGPGYMFRELLEKTYAPYGLKPIICAVGTHDYTRLVWNGIKYNNSAQVDNNTLPGLWVPLPKNAIEGLSEYLGVVANPVNYKIYAKLAFALAAIYGENVDANYLKYVWSSIDYPNPEPTDTGLALLGGFEPENEQDKGWEGFTAYHLPEQCYALLSACYDGHESNIADDAGDSSVYGAKKIDPNFIVVMGGLANNSPGYLLYKLLCSKQNRADFKVPTNAFNFHLYFSNVWLNDDLASDHSVTYAVSPETTFDRSYFTGQTLNDTIRFRSYYSPSTEIWVTEFGYGEAGKRLGKSQYQCYSQPGRYIGDWLIPDRHRSDVKGAWTIRAILNFLERGIDQANTYITFGDSNWWDSPGGGAGQEMFRWDELTDATPGAKVTAIESYELPYDKGGFSAFGFFGNALLNGGYPISRSFWYVALFRNTLKDYTYLGKLKHSASDKIMIHCFKKAGEDKGAYVVYYNDDQNTGIPDVSIDVPSGNTAVKLVKEYIPKLPDPLKIGNKLGTDQLRTGLPTTRKEKYINGEWVVQNRKPDGVNWESFAQSAANYPADPQEGDEVYVLPTPEENPYFPIVGPVCAKTSGYTGTLLGANQYDVQEEIDGELSWVSKYNTPALTWRQADAVADYIDYTTEGQHGITGDQQDLNVVADKVTINISEFPQYILFGGVPKTSFNSVVTELSSKAINSSTIQLWWNNNNTEDTAYEIFVSSLPETGYVKYSEVLFGTNTAVISGLTENQTYYFKIRPKRGEDVGTLSDYISAKPFSFIPDITGLVITDRTATALKLEWVFPTDLVADFYAFGIFRNSGDGNFVLIDQITDQSAREYTDSGLATGKYYSYKMKAFGLNGQSSFTAEVTDRTLLPEESAPVAKSAITDKLGIKLIVTFDLPLAEPAYDLFNAFSLTENDNPRLITGVTTDIVNPNRLILFVPDDSLKSYENNTVLRLSYTAPAENFLKSSYNVRVENFADIRVANVIGNFTNIDATFRINFAPYGTPEPVAEYWNNLIGNPEGGEVKINTLVDTYGRTYNRSISNIYSPTIKSWGYGTLSGLYEGADDISIDTYQPGWNTAYGSFITENYTGKLLLTGLNNANRYKIIAYGSRRNAGAPGKLKINGVYSPEVAVSNNTQNFMVLDDVQCNPDGTLLIELITCREVGQNDSTNLNFMYIEEYLGSEVPPNTDVYIRSLSINEDDGNGQTKSSSVNVSYNVVGVPTHYRISEMSDFADTGWIAIVDPLPFSLSESFGSKVIYVQMKNDTSLSNIKTVSIELLDPYVPVELTKIFVNNDDTETTNLQNTVFFNFYGVPTHYRIGESADLSALEWIEWIGNNVLYQFQSTAQETKYVYAQLKDQLNESAIVVDSIIYGTVPSIAKFVVNDGETETSRSFIPIEVWFSGIITGYAFGLTAADLLNWINLESAGGNSGATFGGIVVPDGFDFSVSRNVAITAITDGAFDNSYTYIIRLYRYNPDTTAEPEILASWSSKTGGPVTLSVTIASYIKYAFIKQIDPMSNSRVKAIRVVEAAVTADFSDLTDNVVIPDLFMFLDFSKKYSGAYDVMAKLRNAHGETPVQQVTLTYNAPALTIESIVINDGDAETMLDTVNVLIDYVGYATHYMLSESPTFDGVAWTELANNPVEFTISGGSGVKTLYCKVKNDAEESLSVSDSITRTALTETAILSFMSGSSNTIEYPVLNSNTLNKVTNAVLAGWSHLQLHEKSGQALDWFLEKNTSFYPSNSDSATAGTYSNIQTSTGYIPVLSGDAGPYPDSVYAAIAVTAGNGETGAKKGRLVLTLPVGNYTCKFVYTGGSNVQLNETQRAACYYRIDANGAAGTPVNVGPSGFTGLNNVDFNAEITFDVSALSDGNVVIYFYNNANAWYRPTIGLLEITKNS